MPAIRTERVLEAPPARVYAALVDFAAWARWNATIPGIAGQPVLGGRVKFSIALPGLPRLPIAAKITTLDPDRELAWSGGVRGAVHGRHYFVLAPEAGGAHTRLLHGEDFTGALAGLMPTRIVRTLTEAYDDANAALARYLAATATAA